MEEMRLHRLSAVRGTGAGMDSVRGDRARGEWRRAADILWTAQRHWDNMERFRRDRERAKRYVFGDQWGDLIVDDSGRPTAKTEGMYIAEQGNVPLTNNHLRNQVRSLVGLYRGQGKEPTCVARDRDEQKLGETMSTVLQYNQQLNMMSEVQARTFEDYVIGGLVCHKKTYGWRRDRYDCWTDVVEPTCFFIDGNMRDLRGWDVEMVGEVHDLSFKQLCNQFASSPRDFQRLREMYRYAHDRDYLITMGHQFGYSNIKSWDFLYTDDPERCKVIEVWRMEMKPRYRCHDWNSGELYKIEEGDLRAIKAENAARLVEGQRAGMSSADIPLIETTWFMDNYWYYYFLTPTGYILREGETPYEHKEHPYVFKAYPFLDGEIHSFVSDVIDQQRYINRLVTMYDWIMRSSAKGVLLFPVEALPDDMSLEDIADEWSRFNGMIAFKAKQGAPLPQQIANNCTNIGISELLNLQLQFMEDITGMHGALQGKQGWSGMSASLYSQQTQNSTMSLLDITESYSSFVVQGAYKDVKNIQQCYDQERVVSIAGKTAVYDPAKLGDVEFDLSITESTTTPVYRAISNDILMELLKMGAINVEQMLEHSSLPFSDDLLQSIRAATEAATEAAAGSPSGGGGDGGGGAVQSAVQSALQQVRGAADQRAVATAYQAMRGGGAS